MPGAESDSALVSNSVNVAQCNPGRTSLHFYYLTKLTEPNTLTKLLWISSDIFEILLLAAPLEGSHYALTLDTPLMNGVKSLTA